jgi:hypothetical protein
MKFFGQNETPAARFMRYMNMRPVNSFAMPSFFVEWFLAGARGSVLLAMFFPVINPVFTLWLTRAIAYIGVVIIAAWTILFWIIASFETVKRVKIVFCSCYGYFSHVYGFPFFVLSQWLAGVVGVGSVNCRLSY